MNTSIYFFKKKLYWPLTSYLLYTHTHTHTHTHTRACITCTYTTWNKQTISTILWRKIGSLEKVLGFCDETFLRYINLWTLKSRVQNDINTQNIIKIFTYRYSHLCTFSTGKASNQGQRFGSDRGSFLPQPAWTLFNNLTFSLTNSVTLRVKLSIHPLFAMNKTNTEFEESVSIKVYHRQKTTERNSWQSGDDFQAM